VSFNRLYNTKNPAQGEAKRVLTLCSAGLLRSPTAAWLLSNDPWNYNTRAAGVNHEYALIGVDEFLIAWADEIVCVEPGIENQLREYCAKHEIVLEPTPVITLKIPDIYRRRDPKLVAAIRKQYVEHQSKEPKLGEPM